MKPEDNNPVNEQNLDADLNSIDQVYRRGHSEEPPDLVDQAVLNKARLAAGIKRSGWHFGGFRWVSAFATASVVVVSLALVMDQITRPPTGPENNSAPASSSESFEVDFQENNDANEMPGTEGEEQVGRERAVEVLRLKQSASPEGKIDLRAAAKPSVRISRDEAAAPTAPVAAPAPEPSQQQYRNEAPQPVVEQARRQSSVADNRAMLDKTVADPDTKEETGSILGMAAEPVAEAAMDEIAVTGNAISQDPLPPDVWINQIIHWKHMQLNEKFEREFAEFRKVYPDYELPDELARIVREGN